MQDPCRHNLVMGKLKGFLLFRLAAFNPSISVNSGYASFIEQRLQQLFNSFHTPTHPPYALMIKRAIMELNEETGSTEEAISEFIRREFEDLPWAHVRILDVHLRKLCLDGELVCTKNGRYTECKRSKKRRNSRDRKRTRILESDEGIERDNGMQVSELHVAGTNNVSRVVELAEWTQEQGEVHWQSTERVEEQGKSEKLLFGVVELEQQSQSQCQGTEVTEEHCEADEFQGWMAQAQSEAEEPQIQEAIMELNDKIVSSKVMNREPYQTNVQQDLIIGKHIQDEEQRQVLKDHYHSEEQQNGVHDELSELCDQQTQVIQERNNEALIEHLTQTQQIEVTNKMSEFGSAETTGDVNLSASHGDPTTVVIPGGNLAGIELAQMQSELQMSCHGPAAVDLVVESKMTDSLSSVDVHENLQEQHLNLGSPKFKSKPVADHPGESLLPTNDHIVKIDLGTKHKLGASLSSVKVHELKLPQNWNQGSPEPKLSENTTFGDLDQPPLKRRCGGRPPNPKPVIDNPQVSLLPSNDGILNEQRPNIFKIEQQQPQPHGNTHQCKEQLEPQDQAQGLVSSPYSEPKETIYTCQPTALNLPVNLTLNSEQQLVVPISEGSPECIISTGIELSLTQLQIQMSSDIYFSDTNQCEEQLQEEDQAQGLGLERPPNPSSDTNQSHQQRQAQPCVVEDSSGFLNKS